MHPAGVQVFEKIWTSVFGTSEIALRLPFVLFGTFSILLVFKIGNRWFNRQTGLIASAILAVLYFPIIQSELARPYSPGLFISLLTAWYFGKVLFTTEKRTANALALGLCFAAGMYTHYFLFLFLLFVGFTGLFFLTKQNLRYYLVAGGIACLLYLPHLPVTLCHLGVGGLGWLGKPDPDFLFQFLFYALNESWIVVTLLLGLLTFAVFRKRNSRMEFQTRSYALMAVWFFGCYLIGHLLSLYTTPILKFPVMLFSFPFFILMISYLLAEISFRKLVLALILLTGISSTLLEKELFGIRHMGYRNAAQHLVEWRKNYGSENIYTIYNLSNPDYMNYYAEQYGDSIHFDWNVIGFGDDAAIRTDLGNRSEEFCILGYAERLTLPQVFETAREFYPNIVDYHRYDNAAVFLLSKEDPGGLEPKIELFSAMDLYDLTNKSWNIDTACIRASADGQSKMYTLEDDHLYGPDFTFTKSQLPQWERFYLKVCVTAIASSGSQLTATLSGTRDGALIQHNGENFWMGHDLEAMLSNPIDSTNQTGSAYFAFDLPDFIEDTDELKISLWNRNGKAVSIRSFEIWLVENIWN